MLLIVFFSQFNPETGDDKHTYLNFDFFSALIKSNPELCPIAHVGGLKPTGFNAAFLNIYKLFWIASFDCFSSLNSNSQKGRKFFFSIWRWYSPWTAISFLSLNSFDFIQDSH